MKLKINRKIEVTISSSKIKELKRIAEQKGKSLEYCLNEAIREYVVLEKSCEEAMKIAGVII